MIFKQCEFCGANLDPNEKCDCQKQKEKPAEKEIELKKENAPYNKELILL